MKDTTTFMLVHLDFVLSFSKNGAQSEIEQIIDSIVGFIVVVTLRRCYLTFQRGFTLKSIMPPNKDLSHFSLNFLVFFKEPKNCVQNIV